jgi:acetyl-CoA carboxylase carboxyltransferase component
LRKKLGEVKLGGIEKRIQKLHTEGKITAREHIDYLIDTNEKTLRLLP